MPLHILLIIIHPQGCYEPLWWMTWPLTRHVYLEWITLALLSHYCGVVIVRGELPSKVGAGLLYTICPHAWHLNAIEMLSQLNYHPILAITPSRQNWPGHYCCIIARLSTNINLITHPHYPQRIRKLPSPLTSRIKSSNNMRVVNASL